MHHAILLVIDLYEFAEATTVVVVSRLGIAKCLQHRPGTEYGLLHATALTALLTERRQVV